MHTGLQQVFYHSTFTFNTAHFETTCLDTCFSATVHKCRTMFRSCSTAANILFQHVHSTHPTLELHTRSAYTTPTASRYPNDPEGHCHQDLSLDEIIARRWRHQHPRFQHFTFQHKRSSFRIDATEADRHDNVRRMMVECGHRRSENTQQMRRFGSCGYIAVCLGGGSRLLLMVQMYIDTLINHCCYKPDFVMLYVSLCDWRKVDEG